MLSLLFYSFNRKRPGAFRASACISGPHVLDVPNSTPLVSAPSISAACIKILRGRERAESARTVTWLIYTFCFSAAYSR